MRWLLKPKNILDESADVLICSANVQLNLSGGVGAVLLERFGPDQQQTLHNQLKDRTGRCAKQGEVFVYESSLVPYRAILHAVAIDAWYHSSPEIIETVVRKSLDLAVQYQARKVALTALATGFGDLSLKKFAAGVSELLILELPPIEEVVICLEDEIRVRELHQFLPDACLDA